MPQLQPSDPTSEVKTYNAWNQLIRVINENHIVTYRYRPNGLRQSITVDGETTTHIWDGMFIVVDLEAVFKPWLRNAKACGYGKFYT